MFQTTNQSKHWGPLHVNKWRAYFVWSPPWHSVWQYSLTLSGILSGITFWHSIWHVYLAFYLAYDLANILAYFLNIYFGILLVVEVQQVHTALRSLADAQVQLRLSTLRSEPGAMRSSRCSTALGAWDKFWLVQRCNTIALGAMADKVQPCTLRSV